MVAGKVFFQEKTFFASTDNFAKHILSRKLKKQLFFILFFASQFCFLKFSSSRYGSGYKRQAFFFASHSKM